MEPARSETGHSIDQVWSRPWLLAGFVAIGYALGSEAAFRFADATDLQAVLFIPAGITLAALVRAPVSMWWVVLSAAALVELGQDVRFGLTTAESLGFAVANLAEPLVGATIIAAAVDGPLDLTRMRHVQWFLAGGVAAGPAVGAVVGALVDRNLGGHDFLTMLWQWWLGDGLAVLLVGGLLLSAGSSTDRRPVRSRSGALLLSGSVALTGAVLTFSDLPLMFVVLTGVVVAGARFGVRAVTITAVLVAMTSAVVFLLQNGEVMVGLSDATGLMVMKLKLLVFTTGGMIVAAEVYERDLLALDRARIQVTAAEEHRLVLRFQRLSLPPEHLDGECFTAEGRYLAASSGLGVGGDWYDIAELPDDRVYICVGDVVGHGAEAAVTMSQLKIAMSVLAREAKGPAGLLAQLDLVAPRIPGAACSTAWVGYFDPAAGVLTYASAGHPPAFLVTADGVVPLEGPAAPPIMVRPGSTKPESYVDIDGDASLLLYTDGLVERRRGSSIDDGIEDVARVLEAARQDRRIDLSAFEPLAGENDDIVLLHVALRPS